MLHSLHLIQQYMLPTFNRNKPPEWDKVNVYGKPHPLKTAHKKDKR